jgi:hypothetical protein
VFKLVGEFVDTTADPAPAARDKLADR